MNIFDKITKIIVPVAVVSSVISVGALKIFSGETPAKHHKDVAVYFVDSISANFYKWFSEGIKQDRNTFPCNVDSVGYFTLMKNIQYLANDSVLTLPEFIVNFVTIYNETGGTMKGVSEIGTDAYFFSRVQLRKPIFDKNGNIIFKGLWKRSYNTLSGNIPAGNYLVSVGALKRGVDDKRIARWNGEEYPIEEPQNIKMLARNADFYKLRGRGIFQLTGRINFVRCVKPIIDFDKMTNYQLDSAFAKPQIYLSTARAYIRANNFRYATINTSNPNWTAWGELISGTKSYYKFDVRCQRLYDAILYDGFYKVFYPNRIYHNKIKNKSEVEIDTTRFVLK
ncbi:MAG: hypothetical protein SFU98_15830 [Leptospiraceae bacterium]|nr:hypothetical protein [Leptospiraceae bacterium]